MIFITTREYLLGLISSRYRAALVKMPSPVTFFMVMPLKHSPRASSTPQVLHSSVAREEVNLQHLEGVAEAVQGHTSPAGAHEVAREALGLRQDWLRLMQDLQEADEALRVGADAHGQYLGLRRRLGQDIDRLQLLLQGLGRELEEGRGGPGAATGDEEQLVGRWKKYTVGPVSHTDGQSPLPR